MTPTSRSGSPANSQGSLQQHSGAARPPSNQSTAETRRLQDIERSDPQERGLLQLQSTDSMLSAPVGQANVTELIGTNLGQEEHPVIAPQHRQVDEAQVTSSGTQMVIEGLNYDLAPGGNRIAAFGKFLEQLSAGYYNNVLVELGYDLESMSPTKKISEVIDTVDGHISGSRNAKVPLSHRLKIPTQMPKEQLYAVSLHTTAFWEPPTDLKSAAIISRLDRSTIGLSSSDNELRDKAVEFIGNVSNYERLVNEGIENLARANSLTKLVTVFSGWQWRTDILSQLEQSVDSKKNVTCEFKTPHILSSSFDKSVASRFMTNFTYNKDDELSKDEKFSNVFFQITVPRKNTRAVSIRDISYNDDEDEMIIKSDSRFTVTEASHRRNESGSYYEIKMELIND